MSERDISPNVKYLIDLLKSPFENEINGKISYKNVEINGQEQFDLEITKEKPTIQFEIEQNSSKYKTLIFLDPDAPSNVEPLTGPFLHWIWANFQCDDASDGQDICEYRSPGPRQGSGKHRYIYLIYESNEKIREEKTFETIEDRRKYRLKEFVEKNHLKFIWKNHFEINV